MRAHAILLLAAAFAARSAVSEGAAVPDLAGYRSRVQAILEAHCAACHGADQPKGGVSFARIDPDLVGG